MKKMILCLSVATLIGVSYKIATADETGRSAFSIAANNTSDAEAYIEQVYNSIDFGCSQKLSLQAFSTAYKGYWNLKTAGKLSDKNVLSVVDFTKSSTEKRLWIIDLKENKLLLNDYVAHGQGSGDEFATAFSNTEDSHQSSIGFYVTGGTYNGQHGTSLYLHGMDQGYNSAAYERSVVIHGADYVSPQFISGQKRLGRSWGCPAVSQQSIGKVINYVKDGTCLFVYYPQKQYMAKAYWLNKKMENLPIGDGFGLRDIAKKRDTTYQYIASASQQQLMNDVNFAAIQQVLP